MLYNNPTFLVEAENQKSEWYKQSTGVRQGCPLSPYLFLIVMTVIFHDIHKQDRTKTEEHRVPNADFSEVLFADDTICVTTNVAAMNRLLNAIEEESGKYGLKLNKSKCEFKQEKMRECILPTGHQSPGG